MEIKKKNIEILKKLLKKANKNGYGTYSDETVDRVFKNSQKLNEFVLKNLYNYLFDHNFIKELADGKSVNKILQKIVIMVDINDKLEYLKTLL